MKKLLCVLPISILFMISFNLSVKATTYQADELTEYIFEPHFRAGDVLEFGSGTATHYEEYLNPDGIYRYSREDSYNAIQILDGLTGENIATITNGQSYTFQYDCYFLCYRGWYENALKFVITRTKAYFFTSDNRRTMGTHSYNLIGMNWAFMDVDEGETVRVFFDYNAIPSGTTVVFKGGDYINYMFGYQDTIEYGTNVEYIDYNYGDCDYIWADIYFQNRNHPTYVRLNINFDEVEARFKNTTSEPSENPSEEPKEEKPKEPTVPSTLPENTVQVSFGDGDNSFSDVKVLNQYLHDTINQKLIADMYASKLRKRASVIMQKNLHAPYCAMNDWKKSSHKIRWKDLNVKKGDSVIVIWYTPTFFGLLPTLQTIQATVVDDGVIEFTIPYMGDMSVMSIVKLI